MKIEVLKLGALGTNCYILKNGDCCIIIDPADEINKIYEAIGDLRIVGCFVTHYHFDHIGALQDILDKYNIKENPTTIEEFNYEIITTPGHKEDSITIYFPVEKIMFTGDFLFKDTIGRTDLVGSNAIDMKKSLEKISTYPDDIIIYPGHGNCTILGHEKEKLKYYYQVL